VPPFLDQPRVARHGRPRAAPDLVHAAQCRVPRNGLPRNHVDCFPFRPRRRPGCYYWLWAGPGERCEVRGAEDRVLIRGIEKGGAEGW
jgi:hypothetical protein